MLTYMVGKMSNSLSSLSHIERNLCARVAETAPKNPRQYCRTAKCTAVTSMLNSTPENCVLQWVGNLVRVSVHTLNLHCPLVACSVRNMRKAYHNVAYFNLWCLVSLDMGLIRYSFWTINIYFVWSICCSRVLGWVLLVNSVNKHWIGLDIK